MARLRTALLHTFIFVFAGLAPFCAQPRATAADPDPKLYWDVADLRAGMKGYGKTVMVGTTLVEFQVEVLGVLRDVNPGRDMILCRLSGCNLEHAGIIQGMSGSPIYIEGKLVGAVAYAWEFAKDPIAGVTPFSQMVEYVQANERRIAAEDKAKQDAREAIRTVRLDASQLDRDALPPAPGLPAETKASATIVSGGGLAGMRPIATPLAATGFSPRALAYLEKQLGPLGMAPIAGGGVLDEILAREANAKLEPGSPVSIAMVTGDFDLSGIGTVTHVEGDRVYAFGHPMMGLGACQLPMMTGYIHTVYPRASVSMKMGSPLKVVGVLDTDVSTAVSGRVGPQPDMMPMSVHLKAGRFAEAHTYHVQVAREPNMMPTLILTVLTSAVDTEGDLPDDLTARLEATICVAGRDPIIIRETLSGARLSGSTGPMALFASVGSTVNMICRNPLGRVRLESIDCKIELENRRTLAEIETVRLLSNRVEPGDTLHALVQIKPYMDARETVELEIPLPADMPAGTHELAVCDLTRTLQRRFRNEPAQLEPKSLDNLFALLQARAEPSRTDLFAHVARPGLGVSVEGQSLPDLPASVRTVIGGNRATPSPSVRADIVARKTTPWVLEGGQTVSFTVVPDRATTQVQP